MYFRITMSSIVIDLCIMIGRLAVILPHKVDEKSTRMLLADNDKPIRQAGLNLLETRNALFPETHPRRFVHRGVGVNLFALFCSFVRRRTTISSDCVEFV